MSNEFKQQIINGYTQKNIWNKLISMLKNLTERSRRENAKSIPVTDAITPVTPVAVTGNDDGKRVPKKFKTSIDFELNEGLIYYLSENKRRLCLPSSVEKNVFHLTHDENMHAGVHRCFNCLTKTFYISRFLKKIRRYIESCRSCQFTQTKRHKPYGELMPIIFSPKIFHTITINFVFVLPGELDALLNVIDKFTQRITLIPGKSIYNASQWANTLLDRLLITD